VLYKFLQRHHQRVVIRLQGRQKQLLVLVRQVPSRNLGDGVVVVRAVILRHELHPEPWSRTHRLNISLILSQDCCRLSIRSQIPKAEEVQADGVKHRVSTMKDSTPYRKQYLSTVLHTENSIEAQYL
jgi:hypothetical protein